MNVTKPIIDWDPAPGCLLVKVLKREELAALYSKAGGNNLSLPDRAGKVSDSVGVGCVIKAGSVSMAQVKDEIFAPADLVTLEMIDAARAAASFDVEVGDYVAFMPYSDLIIEIDGTKYSILQYTSIRAVRKATV